MAVQKLVLDSFTDDDYELIAIHCSLPSYRMAFLLNKYLNLRLYRKKEDMYFQYSDLTASFPFFQYDDPFRYRTYSLLANTFKTKIEVATSINDGLFATSEENYVTRYLVPELKNVDYFLKIETEDFNFSSKSLLNDLQNISQVITAYSIDHTELKSRNNLIFE